MSFKYAFFPTWYYITYPTVWGSYKVPVLACDRVYNQTPAHGAADSILAEGAAEGYNSINDFYKEICETLTFNPFPVSKFYLTVDAVDVDFIRDILSTFGGDYDTRNGSYNGYYPEPTGQGSSADDLIGYCDLSTGVRGSNAFTGAYFAGGYLFLSRILQYSQFTTNDGIEIDFEVWPESGIENKVIDFSHFFKYEGNYRFCIAKLFIYLKDDKYYWYIKLHNETVTSERKAWLDEHLAGYEFEHIYEPDNPYDNHQADGNEGGNGGFDNDSDPVDVPPLPDLDITQTGGIKLYICTPADLANVFSYLASHDPGQSIVKWFSNPIQGITAAYILPYPVTRQTASNITVLGINVGSGNAYTAKQWQEWNLGSVLCDFGFGNCFLDYAPYTKVSIYLPFIGIRELNTDEVIGKSIGVHYQFDNVSGACIAFIKVGTSVRYTFTGSCAVGIPISQSNWGQLYIGAATAAAAVLGGAAAGIGAGIASGTETAGLGQMALGGAAQQAGGALSSILQKPTISRSGSVSGAASTLGVNYPYLIIVRPDKAKVANPAQVTGITCGRTLSLGSLSGYNIIEHVHLSGIAATGPELEEIERLLYEGVVF